MNFHEKTVIMVNENKTYDVVYFDSLEEYTTIAKDIPSIDIALLIKDAYHRGFIKGQDSRVVNELTVALMMVQSDKLNRTLIDCYCAATYYYRSKEAIELAGNTVYKFLSKVAEAMKAMYEYSYTPDDFMDILGICYPEEKDLIANAENLYKKLTIEFIKEED